MQAEKDQYMRDLEAADLVAEEEAEKQRVRVLKENGLYDKEE